MAAPLGSGARQAALAPAAAPLGSRPAARGVGLPQRRPVRRHARGDELFDEGAAQVRRLLERDRKDALGDGQKAEYDLDFDRPAPAKPADASGNGGSGAASTSGSSAIDEEMESLRNPMGKAFKSAPKRDAFGSAARSPFGSDGGGLQGDMWANMEPVPEDEEAWWKQISFAQVAIVLSFVLVIGLMLGTVWVTAKLGAIHFNE